MRWLEIGWIKEWELKGSGWSSDIILFWSCNTLQLYCLCSFIQLFYPDLTICISCQSCCSADFCSGSFAAAGSWDWLQHGGGAVWRPFSDLLGFWRPRIYTFLFTGLTSLLKYATHVEPVKRCKLSDYNERRRWSSRISWWPGHWSRYFHSCVSIHSFWQIRVIASGFIPLAQWA